ncbi:hypothetical protein CK203_062091 [Vitis vinifera]|uniref:Uncharacterized protein n=1 Tax=Vitis vinifera TaxID=29760 RepID=A0A438GMV8_VITVI|nr:hypothetical protein CK203_062091 [Vitis vinifera]
MNYVMGTANPLCQKPVSSKIFELKRQVINTKQGSSTVSEYYNTLKGLLLELHLYQNLEMESSA